jgi:hypothetical protein
MRKRWLAGLLAVLWSCAGLHAQTDAPGDAEAVADAAEEDDFFSSPEVEAEPGAAEMEDAAQAVEEERVGLSGVLQATGSYTMTRPFIQGLTGSGDNVFTNAIAGDFLVDIRLQRSFKAFLDLGLSYVTPAPAGAAALFGSGGGATLVAVKEVFIDFNLANAVYFRAGKQVLKWGTGYFWNPTDLINIEHRSFTDPDALLGGVFGLRMDAVFSPRFHLYTFLNLDGVEDISDVALAARAEFLVGQTEFGLSGWYRSGKIPVFGVDLSAPLFWNLNLTAEASLSWGDNQDKLDALGNPYSIRERLVPRIDVGLSRSFDAFDVEDRIHVAAEFFYNDAGYERDMFDALGGALLDTFVEDCYQPGYYGKYYGALTLTVSRFILGSMTLTLSGLGNLSDLSGTAMAALSYAPVNNFSLSLQLGAYLGEDNREYTVAYTPPPTPAETGSLTNNQLFAILGAKVIF